RQLLRGGQAVRAEAGVDAEPGRAGRAEEPAGGRGGAEIPAPVEVVAPGRVRVEVEHRRAVPAYGQPDRAVEVGPAGRRRPALAEAHLHPVVVEVDGADPVA